MGKPWLKLWTEALHDKKLRRTAPVNRWIWIALLMIAAEQDNEGKLEVTPGIPMTDEDIRESAAVDLSAWIEARDYFLQMGMLRLEEGMYIVKNYVKRQAPKDPTAAERMKRMRKAEATAKELARAGSQFVRASGEMAEAWRDAVGMEPTPGLMRSMAAAEKKYGLEEVLAAIEITGEAGKSTWGYTAGVLGNRANGAGAGKNGKGDEEEWEEGSWEWLEANGYDMTQFTREYTEEERARMFLGEDLFQKTQPFVEEAMRKLHAERAAAANPA